MCIIKCIICIYVHIRTAISLSVLGTWHEFLSKFVFFFAFSDAFPPAPKLTYKFICSISVYGCVFVCMGMQHYNCNINFIIIMYIKCSFIHPGKLQYHTVQCSSSPFRLSIISIQCPFRFTKHGCSSPSKNRIIILIMDFLLSFW